MAIYHFSAKVIQRSRGRSAVAAAAYRAAATLHDEGAGRTINYLDKLGVIHSEILLPVGAPTRWQDREVLWNEVERIERRCDAVLARGIELALPKELSRAEAIRLVQTFVQAQFVGRGMVADLNVHWGQAADGTPQPHAHVMLSMRWIAPGPEGRPEEGGFGLKERGWNDKALLRSWREAWAHLVNVRLHEAGFDLTVDHRSNAARGIALEPQHKIGPAGARRAVRGEAAERTDEHRAIARRNGERILLDPSLALQALTREQSTVTRQDLARLVNRHSDGAAQFAAIMARVEASPELVRVGQDGRGRVRFSTREMVAVERRMEAAALDLSRSTTHGVAIERRQALIAGTTLADEQRQALGHVTRSRNLSVVVGFAGTGKSLMLGVARQAWAAEGYTVRGAALSGIAAAGLEAGAGITSRTIASWEYAWARGREQLTARDVLVVDEAGMIDSRQMERVLAAVQQAGAKLVLAGDYEQLQAIEAGAAFRAIVERVGAAELTEVRRQLTPWQREATRELATGRTREALDRYAGAGMAHDHATDAAAEDAVVAGWQAGRQHAPGDSRIMLAHTRDGVRRMNDRARGLRRQAGELGDDQVLPTERGERAFAVEDHIYFLRNERGLGVRNGTLGTITAITGAGAGARLTVRLDQPDRATGEADVATFGLAEYSDIDHGYAATVHKSQGITVDWAHVVATPGMDRHLAYVALSRHRHGIALHWSREGFASQEGLANRLGRERAKDTTLDYGESESELCAAYAERRGLRPAAPVHGLVAADAGLVQRNLQCAQIEPGIREALTALQVMAERQAATAAALQAAVERSAQRRAEQDAARAQRSRLDTLLTGLRPTDPPGPTPMFEAVIAAEQARREREQPLPPLPGVPYRPVTKEQVDAMLAAEEGFGVRQLWVTEWLQWVYRDPAEAQARLEALLQRAGGVREAISELRQQGPGLLGELKGSEGFLSAAASQTERQRARLAATGFVRVLDTFDDTRSRAADAFRRTEEARRRIEAVAVPGLSEQAMRAVAALRAAGTVPGWQGPMPGEPVQPSAADIARAGRVAPVWQGIRADAALYAEVGRFMAAVQERLPGSYDQPAADGGTQLGTVQAVSSLLHAACELQRANPALQAYAAAEPERQTEAKRKADEAARRQAEARRVLAEQRAAQNAEYEAMMQRFRDASRPRRRKSPGPSTRPGGGSSMR